MNAATYDVCMVVRNTFRGDTRVEKEAQTLGRQGLRVLVLALADAELPMRQTYDDFEVERLQPDPLLYGRPPRPPHPSRFRYPTAGPVPWHIQTIFWGRALMAHGRRGLAKVGYHSFTLARLLRARPKIIHCHDLNTLAPGYVAARWLRAPLVYDSHELWLDRNLPLDRRQRWDQRLKERALESFLITKAARVITVSDGIADVLMTRYGIPRPLVVLNVPQAARPLQRRDLRARVGRAGPLLLYVGGVVHGRGLEDAIMALPALPEATLVLMGTRAQETWQALSKLAQRLGVMERVVYLPPVPQEEVLDWAAGADLGLCTIEPRCLSYELCLPNKLFQYAFAGVPVVASDLPELRQWVQRHRLGALYRSRDPGDLARTIGDVLARRIPVADPEEREAFRQAWSWEQESGKLLTLYRELGVL